MLQDLIDVPEIRRPIIVCEAFIWSPWFMFGLSCKTSCFQYCSSIKLWADGIMCETNRRQYSLWQLISEPWSELNSKNALSIWHPLIAAAMQRAEPSVLVINDNATQEFDAAFCCSCAILSECHLERWFSSVLTVLSYGFPWTKRLNGTILWCHHVGCWL